MEVKLKNPATKCKVAMIELLVGHGGMTNSVVLVQIRVQELMRNGEK